MIKNIILGLLALVFINWIFNISKISKLEKRYDKALEEHKRLVKEDSLNQITIDSLEIILSKADTTK